MALLSIRLICHPASKTHVTEVIRRAENETQRYVLLLDVLQLQLNIVAGSASVNLDIVVEDLKRDVCLKCPFYLKRFKNTYLKNLHRNPIRHHGQNLTANKGSGLDFSNNIRAHILETVGNGDS